MNTPPLLVNFSSPKDYFLALGVEATERNVADISALVERQLPPVVSEKSLGVLFGFTASFVKAMCHNSKKYYRTFEIRKGKKRRLIHAPKVSLKIIQKWLGAHFAAAIQQPDYVCGFVPGRSAIHAAQIHCNAEWIYSVDIKDFFSTTKKSLVKASIASLGYTERAAEIISLICCFNDNLAQGAPSSPVISNICFAHLDRKLVALANKYNVRYSRYADDVVFSGQQDFPSALENEVKIAFENECWTLAPEKEYFAKKPNRLKVHGLFVNGSFPRLTKGYRNRIRAYKHLMEGGKVSPEDLAKIGGHLNYARAVESWKK